MCGGNSNILFRMNPIKELPSFFQFHQVLFKGKKFVHRKTGKEMYAWEAFVYMRDQWSLLLDDVHKFWTTKDKPGWVDGKLVDHSLLAKVHTIKDDPITEEDLK